MKKYNSVNGDLVKICHKATVFLKFIFRGIFIGVRSLGKSYLELPIVPEIKVIKFRFQLLNIRCPYTSYSPYMRETRYAHTSSCKYPICSGFIYVFIYLFYCSGFCHTLKWNSHGVTCVPHPDPPSHLPLHPIPLGLLSAPGPSACLMHPTWAGGLFHPR